MQQGVQTDAMYTIQQCWELLANNVASVCTGLKRHYCKVQCIRTQHCWLTTPNVIGCYMLRPFAYPLHVVACCWELLRKAGLKRVKHLATRKRTQRARSIQTKFPEISDQNSMDRFGPTGKVSKKLVHFLRWTTFRGRKFWLNGSRPTVPNNVGSCRPTECCVRLHGA